MPHGAPDWSKYRTTSTTYPVLDLAELAARLGTPATFDRRGDVVWMDDFSHGINKWYVTSNGVGGTAIPDHLYADVGPYSAKLTTPGTATNYTRITHYCHLPLAPTIGLEARIGLWQELHYFQWEIWAYDGSDATYYQIQIDLEVQPNLLQYLNSGGTWTTFRTDFEATGALNSFNYSKLVVDWQAKTYTRFILNDHISDLTGIAGRHYSTTSRRHTIIRFRAYGLDTGTGPAWVDGVIITHDEPA